MSLGTRIVLTLLAIAAILLVPALYGLSVLRELRGIAEGVQPQVTEASAALERLRGSLERLESAQQAYVAAPDPDLLPGGDTAAARVYDVLAARVDSTSALVRADLARLARTRYAEAARPALDQWDQVTDALAREREMVRAGALDEASAHFARAGQPALESMVRLLYPVDAEVATFGADQVRRAADVAANAATVTLGALAAALAVALVIGAWLTRTLVRPIGELRRGMAHVVEGDFEPELRISDGRGDELGDLARSFGTMTVQLAELDRLKAEFVSVASHEIKTPLSVIRGYVSLLADGIYGQVTEQQQKTLNAVSDQTDRLTRLVQRLLDVSRFEAGGGRMECRAVDPGALVRELGSEFEVLAYQNDIDFHVEVRNGVPQSIQADPDRLNEVLGNLLSNAFKFTARGGRIRLVARPEQDGVAVEVTDNGVGIPEDKLPRIFEKFFQVENEAQPRSVGSGLGLAIAREIVEAHGGTIGAESRVGRGTRFRVTLPAQPPRTAARA